MNFAEKDQISMSEAIKKVQDFDVKAFQKSAKKMVEDKDFSSFANERLRAYNATMRINRLEMLKAQIGQEMIAVDAVTEQQFKKLLTKRYQDEVKRQAGILGQHKLDDSKKRLTEIINASFHGATWSQRLWVSHVELKSKLDALLRRSMIQGQNPKTIVNELMPLIKDDVKTRRFVAERLAITESARVQDQAQMDSFKSNGFEYVQWIAEPSACEQCLDIANAHDGIYSIAKVPSIPIHPSCRCSKSATMDKPKESKNKSTNIKLSGAISSALNDKNDPDFKKRIKYADQYYNSLRNSKRDDIVTKVAEASGMDKNDISKVFVHILDSKYMLYDNDKARLVLKNFDSSYDMAQSIQRLRLGKAEEHDIIMLKHELLELKYMDDKGLYYTQAHELTDKKFNYKNALKRWMEGK